MLDAGEGAQRRRDRRIVEAGGAGGGGRGGGVLAVVRARDERLGRQLVVRGELDAARSAGTGPKPRGTTATSSAVWFSKIRSFAARYASKSAVAVEMVGLEVEQHGDPRPGARRRPRAGSSRARRRSSRPPRRRRRARSAAVPTLPATRVRRGPSIAPSSSVVVVFPFVPVTPRIGFAEQPRSRARSRSRPGPRARAPPRTSGASPGTPGLLTSTSTPSSRERDPRRCPSVRSARDDLRPARLERGRCAASPGAREAEDERRAPHSLNCEVVAVVEDEAAARRGSPR